MTTTSSRGAVKGTVAAATGIAILLGGAGSFALWHDSQQLGSGDTITAGELTIDDYAEGTWVDADHGNAEITDIAAFRMVPGDTLKREDVASVIAYGDNLEIASAVDLAASIPAELQDDVTVTVDLDTDAIDTTVETPQELPITVTVSYDENGDNAGQTATVDLDQVTVSLNQVAA